MENSIVAATAAAAMLTHCSSYTSLVTLPSDAETADLNTEQVITAPGEKSALLLSGIELWL